MLKGIPSMLENFHKFKNPYSTSAMRIKRPEGIPNDSKTLYFMGCLSTIKIPRYTEHSLEYLMKQGIEFTILNKEICCGYPFYVSGAYKEFEECKERNTKIFKSRGFEKIICLCPACYHLFRSEYTDINIQIDFISEYLKPSNMQKSGKVSIQHLCQLKNRGREDVNKFVDKTLRDSGYEVIDVPHWCCGGGIGYMHRTDVVDKIAQRRISDFKEGDYCTTYCPSCWWILSRFGRKFKIGPKLLDIFQLLT